MVDFIVIRQGVIFSESDLSSYEVLIICKHCVQIWFLTQLVMMTIQYWARKLLMQDVVTINTWSS